MLLEHGRYVLGLCCLSQSSQRSLADAVREDAYKHFITSLKRSSTFAPAFTSLGIYYAEFATPPDPKRANKCFQKAFELDPREGDAARRLAEGFAEERDWDLVEVVAQRTIDGEGGLNAGLESTAGATRYLPVNAWAWKAIGVVEMVRIFTVCALRISAHDFAESAALRSRYSSVPNRTQNGRQRSALMAQAGRSV